MTTEVFENAEALAQAAADAFVEAAAQAKRFTVALAGGSTPKRLYSLLAEAPVEWPRVHLYWGDERCVPPIDDASNYRMVKESLLDHIAIPPANVHRMRGEIDPAAGADEYEKELRATLEERFDLVLLGLGADGHTASLFPGSPTLHENERWFVADLAARRLTLTAPVINNAKRVWFLVAGKEKAGVLQRIKAGEGNLPAQLIQPSNGELRWFVDRAAGSPR